MVATGKVVVGVDGTPGALNALGWACHYATLAGTGVDVVRVWAPTDHRPPADGPAALADLVAGWVREHAVTVEVQVREVDGMVVQALVDESHHAALVVLGSRGHHHGPVAIMGSVSRAVAERAACPVVVVHPHDHVPGIAHPDAAAAPAGDPA
ncbi:MAG: universal stress protein [Ilumatobacteraceae bacterium]